MKTEEKAIYYILVRRIEQQGIKTTKRHGYYITLDVFGDYSLKLDTWSNAIQVYKAGKYDSALGIDFGGFKCDLRMVKFWLGHIPKFVKEQQKDG